MATVGRDVSDAFNLTRTIGGTKTTDCRDGQHSYSCSTVRLKGQEPTRSVLAAFRKPMLIRLLGFIQCKSRGACYWRDGHMLWQPVNHPVHVMHIRVLVAHNEQLNM
jgi:hypothetical protein